MILTEIEKREIQKYSGLFDFSEALKDKTILVTGSKGIVGSGITKWLLFENATNGLNCHIIASTRDKARKPDYIESSDSIEYCTFGKEIEECSGKHIDYIVHAAAPTSNRVFQSQRIV